MYMYNVCTYVCVHASVWQCMCVSTSMGLHAYTFGMCVFVFVCVYMCVFVFVYVCMYVCVCVCVCVCVYVCVGVSLPMYDFLLCGHMFPPTATAFPLCTATNSWRRRKTTKLARLIL